MRTRSGLQDIYELPYSLAEHVCHAADRACHMCELESAQRSFCLQDVKQIEHDASMHRRLAHPHKIQLREVALPLKSFRWVPFESLPESKGNYGFSLDMCLIPGA